MKSILPSMVVVWAIAPALDAANESPSGLAPICDIVAVSASYGLSLALSRDGTVWSWGIGGLGDGLRNPSRWPVRVKSLPPTIAISAGGHALVIDDQRNVWAFGNGQDGQLGNGQDRNQTAPVQVVGLTGVVAISAGGRHSLALKDDGTVWAWGSAEYGQLGDGQSGFRVHSNLPQQVTGVSDVTAIAAASDWSLALRSNGDVWAWGDNLGGQLGIGCPPSMMTTPVQVPIDSVVAIAAGVYTVYALRSDGSLFVWGGNVGAVFGGGTQNPLGSCTPYESPVMEVSAVWPGASHCLARKTDATFWGWGENGNGQLGNGQTVQYSAPVEVGLSGVATMAGGFHYSLAAKSDGTAWGWGHALDGELGIGPTMEVSIPTPVQVQFDWVPDDLGNWVRAVRQGQDVVLALKPPLPYILQPGIPYSPPPFFRVYRDTDKPFVTPIPLPDATEETFVDVGALSRQSTEYYRIRGLSGCTRTEGP